MYQDQALHIWLCQLLHKDNTRIDKFFWQEEYHNSHEFYENINITFNITQRICVNVPVASLYTALHTPYHL